MEAFILLTRNFHVQGAASALGSRFGDAQVAGWLWLKTLPIGADMFRRMILLPFLAAIVGCSPEPAAPDISIDPAWVRPALTAGNASAGYLTIRNGGGGDRLLGAASEVAGRVTLHASSNEGGISRMRPLEDGLSIEEGQTVQLEPGANHLMLEQLKRPLKTGESITITLNFERSGPRRIEALVANGPANNNHAGHGAH